MEKKYVFFKMTSAPIVDSDDDTDKNSVECQRFVITCTVKKTNEKFLNFWGLRFLPCAQHLRNFELVFFLFI